MSVKLLNDHYLEFLSLKEAAQARLSLHLSKYHNVGNYMSRLIYKDYKSRCPAKGTNWHMRLSKI